MPVLSVKQRLSDYCRDLFVELPSRKSVKKALEAGRILLNHQPGSTGNWVREGDLIMLLAPEQKNQKVYEMRIPVVLETEEFALVNKPGGLPISGPKFRTLVNALPHNLQPSSKKDALAQPYPLHRLDSPTTGLVLVAKTAKAHLYLGRLFARRLIKKRYQAIVTGKTAEEGSFLQPIDGKEARTYFKQIKWVPSLKNGHLTHLELFPETGRTHQLRRHLSAGGHPIMGDKQFGMPGHIYRGQGLFLCATGLSFANPFSEEQVEVSIDPPRKFRKLLQREAQMWQRKRGSQ